MNSGDYNQAATNDDFLCLGTHSKRRFKSLICKGLEYYLVKSKIQSAECGVWKIRSVENAECGK